LVWVVEEELREPKADRRKVSELEVLVRWIFKNLAKSLGDELHRHEHLG